MLIPQCYVNAKMMLTVDSNIYGRLRNTLLVTGNILGDDFGDGDEVLAAERGETGGSRQHLGHVRAQQRQILPQQSARAADLGVWQQHQPAAVITNIWQTSRIVNRNSLYVTGQSLLLITLPA